MRELVHADAAHAARRAGCTGRAGTSPARDVGLRSGSSIEYRLLDLESERTIGTVDDARVFSVAHPGAVYLHQGRQYRVERLDRDEHIAMLEPYDDADEYTQARTTTDITIVSEDAFAPLGDAIVHLGQRSRCAARSSRSNASRSRRTRVIEVRELDLPERALVTRACWYTVPPEVAGSRGHRARRR